MNVIRTIRATGLLSLRIFLFNFLLFFVSFSDQTPVILFKFPMIAVLAVEFPFTREASSEICPRWVKLNKSPVCFGAK